jgi:hypothetical protein
VSETVISAGDVTVSGGALAIRTTSFNSFNTSFYPSIDPPRWISLVRV